MAFRTSANIDKNHNKGLIASNASGNGVLVLTGAALTNSQPMHVAVVDSTGAHITALSNVQYTEADTDTTITGTAIMWEDAADTLRAVSATKPLPVDIVDATGVTITVDSEFPAAAAITDNFANPTTTSIMSMGMLYDGSTWDRALGNSTDGALVNLGTNNDVTVTSGGITETNSAAIKTAVEILDNAISGNEMQVDVLTMPAVTVDSEFPAAAALTDDFANPTTTNVAGMNMLWDGATWDRALGNSTDGALVNLGTNNDVTVTGSVTANAGTNLNTSALLTSSDFAAAFGTAGVADAQVMSVQGIASMTPILATVTATDLDVRNLVAATDIVTAELSAVDNAVLDAIAASVAAIDTDTSTIITNTGNTATSLAIMDDWDNAASDGASVSGDVAHDAADAGEPVKIGAKVITSPKGLTLPVNADRTDLFADSDGMMMVKLNTSGADLISERVSNTDGASTAFTNFSAVASTYNYVTAIHAFRTDAGTTPIYIDFRTGTAGAILYSMVLPPNGGATLPASGTPYFKTAANNALAFDVSAATTTVYISATGFQSKV